MKINFSNPSLSTQKSNTQSSSKVSFSSLTAAEKAVLSHMPTSLAEDDVVVMTSTGKTLIKGKLSPHIQRLSEEILEKARENIVLLGQKPNTLNLSDLSLARVLDIIFPQNNSGHVEKYNILRTEKFEFVPREAGILRSVNHYRDANGAWQYRDNIRPTDKS